MGLTFVLSHSSPHASYPKTKQNKEEKKLEKKKLHKTRIPPKEANQGARNSNP